MCTVENRMRCWMMYGDKAEKVVGGQKELSGGSEKLGSLASSVKTVSQRPIAGDVAGTAGLSLSALNELPAVLRAVQTRCRCLSWLL